MHIEDTSYEVENELIVENEGSRESRYCNQEEFIHRSKVNLRLPVVIHPLTNQTNISESMDLDREGTVTEPHMIVNETMETPYEQFVMENNKMRFIDGTPQFNKINTINDTQIRRSARGLGSGVPSSQFTDLPLQYSFNNETSQIGNKEISFLTTHQTQNQNEPNDELMPISKISNSQINKRQNKKFYEEQQQLFPL